MAESSLQYRAGIMPARFGRAAPRRLLRRA
jgi:hypothetical protein